MIAFIKGKVELITDNAVIIENGGIGYRVYTSRNTIEKLKKGSEATIYTYLHVREDILNIYGFCDNEELNCFKMLISVSGVGPKVGLSILSELRNEMVAVAIVTDDVKSLCLANGVGPKVAKRIILELKDKIKNEDLVEVSVDSETESGGSVKSDVINALLVLGYSRGESLDVLKTINMEGLTLEDALKLCLKKMMK